MALLQMDDSTFINSQQIVSIEREEVRGMHCKVKMSNGDVYYSSSDPRDIADIIRQLDK